MLVFTNKSLSAPKTHQIEMEIFLIRLLQFVLAISLLVLLHEGGHMFFAKLFGVRVEKFFVFFDVGIGKWKGHLFSFKDRKSVV